MHWRSRVAPLGRAGALLTFILAAPWGTAQETVPAAPVEHIPEGTGGDGYRQWRPIQLDFEGPFATQTDTLPNPFLDLRLEVTFTAPSGATWVVPGYFAGDGNGGAAGNVWRVLFSADEVGTWTWTASMRAGSQVAVSLDPSAGTPTSFDGQTGSLAVIGPSPDATGFLVRGRLSHVGEHYLRHADGTYFLKSGTNSPENLFGFSGFTDVQDIGGSSFGVIHDYASHVADWNPGDPEQGAPGAPDGIKGIIGALNYLAGAGVNAAYFLPMNLGGDGQETCPFVGYAPTAFDRTHYHVERLDQWRSVFDHAQRKGIQLQVVLAETEIENMQWLDGGGFGVERKLFFREMVARFAHNLAIKWNLSEENDFSIGALQSMASYLRSIDPYDHPISVHSHLDDFSDYPPLLGNDDFEMTSIQFSVDGGQVVEDWRAQSAAAGDPWVIDMDEIGWPGADGSNADDLRKQFTWDVYLSGGNIEWYMGVYPLPLGGDFSCEDFRTRDETFDQTRIAREFLEALPFWKMEPADGLVTGESAAYGGAEVFAQHDRAYAVYLPDASQGGVLDLTGAPGDFELQWFDPRLGVDAGPATLVQGGGPVSLGTAPSLPGEDWVVRVEARSLVGDVSGVSLSLVQSQTLTLDAGPDYGLRPYQIVGSWTGTSPGTWVNGVLVPLTYDPYSAFTLTNPVTPFYTGFIGSLDADGRSTATITPGLVLPPFLVGLNLHHAFLTSDGVNTFASEAEVVTLLP